MSHDVDAGASRPARILLVDDDLVDDDENALAVCSDALKRWGYDVVTACGKREAVALLSRSSLDLIITAGRMSDGSGLDLLEHVRGLETPPPVIVIAGVPSVMTAVRALKAGADDYIRKPFSLYEIREKVEGALSASRSRKERKQIVRELNNRVRELTEVLPKSDQSAVETSEPDADATRVSRLVQEIAFLAGQVVEYHRVH